MNSLVNTQAARRVAIAAAFGGGGLSLLGATAYGLLKVEARLARRVIHARPLSGPPVPDGVYGDGDRPAISFVVVGDSAATGYGVETPDETPGALLAAGMAQVAHRPVELATVAQVGARTPDLAEQIDKAVDLAPDVALMIIGSNDITNEVKLGDSVRLLGEAVRRLRDIGCAVVVGTCPDLGTVRPIRPPLRWLARRASRQLAAAQTVAAVEAGARTVSLGSILGPEFSAAPAELFSEDQFHPSPAGYAHAAAATLSSLVGALGLWSADDEPEGDGDQGVLPIAVAATTAAEGTGTEVSAATVDGRAHGPRGRWTLVRKRRRQPLPTAAEDERSLS